MSPCDVAGCHRRCAEVSPFVVVVLLLTQLEQLGSGARRSFASDPFVIMNVFELVVEPTANECLHSGSLKEAICRYQWLVGRRRGRGTLRQLWHLARISSANHLRGTFAHSNASGTWTDPSWQDNVSAPAVLFGWSIHPLREEGQRTIFN